MHCSENALNNPIYFYCDGVAEVAQAYFTEIQKFLEIKIQEWKEVKTTGSQWSTKKLVLFMGLFVWFKLIKS